MNRTECLFVMLFMVACSSEGKGDDGSAGADGAASSSSSATSSATATSTSSANGAGGSTGDGAGGSDQGGGTSSAGGDGGSYALPALCAAQLTEEECYAAGCNGWDSYYELTIVDNVCESAVVGPFCMHYTTPGGGTAFGSFARLFEAELPRVLGDGNLAVPDGWARCGEPGSEGLRECCCYQGAFAEEICDGIESDLP